MLNHLDSSPILEQLSAALANLEQDAALRHKERFIERAEALDFIDFQLIHGIQPLLGSGASELAAGSALLVRAQRLQSILEHIDQDLIAALRTGIRSAASSRAELDRLVRRYAAQSAGRNDGLLVHNHLDDFVNSLLSVKRPALETQVEREPEMVFFQATPVRYILEMIDRAHIAETDVFYDLGCGLGRVLMLVTLLTGAAAVGVEVERSYCRYAQLNAEALKLTTIQIQNADARVATYTDGSIFFMYHPFTGEILERVLQRLRIHAEGRRIRLCTLGRCTLAVAQQEWLELSSPGECNEFQLAVFTNKRLEC